MSSLTFGLSSYFKQAKGELTPKLNAASLAAWNLGVPSFSTC